MNTNGILEKVKRRLGITDTTVDDVLEDFLNDSVNVALNICNIANLEAVPPTIEPTFQTVVTDTVCGLYNQRGNEGKTGYSTGGQGATYEDVIEKMRLRLIRSGCRM